LHYAHQHGLIHLDAQGRLLLADFGVSVLLESSTHASLRYYAGTPLYTAPEQWLEQPRPASDQYALAITCYQLLTGRLPFTASLYALMHGHLHVVPPPPDALNPLIPAAVAAVLQRATPACSPSPPIARLWRIPLANRAMIQRPLPCQNSRHWWHSLHPTHPRLCGKKQAQGAKRIQLRILAAHPACAGAELPPDRGRQPGLCACPAGWVCAPRCCSVLQPSSSPIMQ